MAPQLHCRTPLLTHTFAVMVLMEIILLFLQLMLHLSAVPILTGRLVWTNLVTHLPYISPMATPFGHCLPILFMYVVCVSSRRMGRAIAR